VEVIDDVLMRFARQERFDGRLIRVSTLTYTSSHLHIWDVYDLQLYYRFTITTSLEKSTIMSAAAGPSTKPVTVVYCNVCSLPAEYCEFGSSISKCKTWLEEQDPQLFAKLYGEGKRFSLRSLLIKIKAPGDESILIVYPA
jgi:hypothetical protein